MPTRQCVICDTPITDGYEEIYVDRIERDDLRGWAHAACLDTYLDALDEPQNT